MDCCVSFEDVAGAEVTAHRKPLSLRRAGFLDMTSEIIVNTRTVISRNFFLGGGESIVIKLSLDPRVQQSENY
jgi:hypothetical protein